MDLLYNEFRHDLEAFQTITAQFVNKEVSVKEYKGFSGRYGSYAQKGGETSMLRLRLNGGRISKDQLKFVVESIKSYRIDKLHFTTCQTIQLHNLKPDIVSKLMLEALDHHIVTWGGGGDYPRNVMVSPLSGVEKGEHFNVMPYAEAAADYLLEFIDRVKLPRKLKVGFSNSADNITHVTFRDFGFAAAKNGTFDVYSGGGLGSNPRMGVCIERGIAPCKILYYIKAMIDMFIAYGDFENRAKARTRYMQEVLGQDGYVSAYRKKLSDVFASGENLDLDNLSEVITKTGDGSAAAGSRVIPQKQDGLYSVYYHPIGGLPSPEKMGILYHAINDMEQVELRLTPDQGVYIINCTGAEAQKLLSTTEDGAVSLFESSVACIGASVCQAGVRDSQKLLQTLVQEISGYAFRDGVLPKIHISGCPSSCGTHQTGSLGFHGGVKLLDQIPYPAFTLHVNGNYQEGCERFGERWGVILEQDIPSFLIKVGRAVQADETVFELWMPEHMEELREIAKGYLK